MSLLTALAESPTWMRQAACRGGDDLFFPPLGRADVATKAKLICHGCPVRSACLDYALETNQEWGVWGGKSERERRRLRRARAAGPR